jgi:hypothetical protein
VTAASKGEARIPRTLEVSNKWGISFVLMEIPNAEWHLRSDSIDGGCNCVCALAYLQRRFAPAARPSDRNGLHLTPYSR